MIMNKIISTEFWNIDISDFTEEAREGVVYACVKDFILSHMENGKFDLEKVSAKECFELVEILTEVVLQGKENV